MNNNNNNIETKAIPQFIYDTHTWIRQIFAFKHGELYPETEGFRPTGRGK